MFYAFVGRWSMRWAVVAICVAGCSRAALPPDPESSRLATGTEVVSFNGQEKLVAVWDTPEWTRAMKGLTMTFVPSGTKLRVISDVEELDRPARRLVRVLILEGDYRMAEGTVWRDQLRPIKP
jgi:hypothetical protein